MKVWGHIFAFALAGVLCAACLTGCGKDKQTETPAEDPTGAPTTTTAPTTTASEYPFVGYVNDDGVNVRSMPGTEGNYPIGGVNFGNTVTVIGAQGDWYQIQWTDFETQVSSVAYISMQYVQRTMPVRTTATVTETTTTTVAP